MLTNRWLKPALNMVLPAVLFYACYKAAGIMPATILSVGYSIASIIYSHVRKEKISNSKIVGVVGLIGSAAAIGLTGEAKYYYLPALIENAVFLIFMLILTIRKKSVLHYLAKDFRIESLECIPEQKMFGINLLWMLFFVCKICSKIIGILFLDFEHLYWLVYLLGDPMTIVVIILSIILIRRQFSLSYVEREGGKEA